MKNLCLLGLFAIGMVSFTNLENKAISVEDEAFFFCKLERCETTTVDTDGGSYSYTECWCV